ncbi:acylglycerol lipase [Sarracenia purpurea var. burkii]
MSHPIHEANEKSPFGELTREEFYSKHQILHQESFMRNKQNMKIFTQSWRPDSPAADLKGLVAMIHGYTDESSWLIQLTAVAIAKAGFYVCALDLQGHGYSDGPRCHIPTIQPLVDDCVQFFDSACASHPTLPAFIYGESFGGAIAILICLRQRGKWNGLILSGALCGVSKKFKPVWPLEELLPVVALVAPTWRIWIMVDPGRNSYKEEWKKNLVMKSPNRVANGKVTAATAAEALRVCEYIQRNCAGLELPMLIVHGSEDRICDPESARMLHRSATSGDKTFKLFPGMWHQFIGEPNERVDEVFETILSWIKERAGNAKTNSKT